MTTPTRTRLSEGERDVLVDLADGEPRLRNSDEGTPQWWLEGRGTVYHQTAKSLLRRGFVRFSAHWGGLPGVTGYSITPAGLAALSQKGEP